VEYILYFVFATSQKRCLVLIITLFSGIHVTELSIAFKIIGCILILRPDLVCFSGVIRSNSNYSCGTCTRTCICLQYY